MRSKVEKRQSKERRTNMSNEDKRKEEANLKEKERNQKMKCKRMTKIKEE